MKGELKRAGSKPQQRKKKKKKNAEVGIYFFQLHAEVFFHRKTEQKS